MSRAAELLLIALIVAAASSALLIMHAQQANEWLVSVTPTEAYIDQPITVKVYSYSPITQQIYRVSCNLTLVNSTDVIWFKKVSGAPIIYRFTVPREGGYTLEMYCADTNGNTYEASPKLTIKYPTPVLEPSAYWGRPLNITVKTPYKYSGVPVTLAVNGTAYTKPLENGEAEFTGLPTIYGEETVYVTLFGETLNYTITPRLPHIEIIASQKSFVKTTEIETVLKDSLGVLGIKHPIKYIVNGDCRIIGANYVTGEKYTVISENNKPLSPASCNITAVARVGGGTIENTTTLTILPVNITASGIAVSNTTPWNYTIKAYVDLDAPVHGNLTIFIDDKPVSTVTGYTAIYTATYTAELMPGTHLVTAWFTANESTVELKPRILYIPKHPYRIAPPPSRVYAGDPVLVSNAYWYRYIPGNDTVILLAYYPGNNYYAPASQMYKVKIIYPVIRLTENNITVRNAAPGSNIKIYCTIDGREKLIMELYSTEENYTYSFPATIRCDSVKAVYTYHNYKQIVYANTPEPVKILTTTCIAGAPCMLLEKNPEIIHVDIGVHSYRPGTYIELPAGYYTMKIYMRDGYVITVPITVKEPEIKVVVYRNPLGGWVADIQAPPFAKISIVLSDGRTVSLSPGTHYLFEEPVSAYWVYGSVEFIKAKILP